MALVPSCYDPSLSIQAPPGSVETLSVERGGEFSLAAFNQLVLAHQDDAFNFACYLLGDPDTAADVVQKSFLNAYLNIEKFHGQSFRSWLFKIIKNASIDEFRSASHRRNRSLDAIEGEEEWRYFPVDQETPEESMEKLEREQAIHEALNRIEEPFRTVLVLIDIQGFDYEEAAQIAGIPVGTAKSRLSRARLKLRSEMESFVGAF